MRVAPQRQMQQAGRCKPSQVTLTAATSRGASGGILNSASPAAPQAAGSVLLANRAILPARVGLGEMFWTLPGGGEGVRRRLGRGCGGG